MFESGLPEEITHRQAGVAAADDDCLYLFNVTIHKAPEVISSPFWTTDSTQQQG